MAKQKIVLDAIKMHSTREAPPKGKKGMGLCSPMYVNYPCLYINTKQAPSLEGKDAGEEVEMLIKGKITSHSINSNQTADGKGANKRESFDLQITEMGLIK